MKKILMLMTVMIAVNGFAQVRMTPHVTPVGSAFETRFILANPTAETQNFNLTPFTVNGAALSAVAGSLDPYETRFATTQELFNSDQVSHFLIGQNDQIAITTVYQDAARNNSQAHVGESNMQSAVWRIHPGDLDDVIDGVAVVNPNGQPLDVKVRQVTAAGEMLGEVTLFSGLLESNAKGLYLFQTDFTNQAQAFYEIYSDQAFAVTALRFSTAGDNARFFWQTAALPLPQLPPLETENQDPRIGQVAMLSTIAHNVSGRAVIADERTIRLENFNFDGRGINVQVYLAMDRDYLFGFPISGDIRGPEYNNATLEFTLPDNMSLDDFNSISIWCVPALADFGSGSFQ